MKKILVLFVTCFLVIGNCSLVTAQVKIGGNASDPITPGAVLDLSSATSGGLLLPRVTLTVADALPNEWIDIVENTDLLESGLMVYNLGGAGLKPGVYIWQGTNGWALANAGGGSGPVPESITISADPSGAVQVDATQTLTATVLPVNAGWTTVNWGGNNLSVAIVDAVEGSVNTATVTGIHNGTTTVTASLDGVSSAPFTIVVDIPATDISITGAISPASLSVGGKTLQLGYSLTPPNSTDAVSWHSSDETVATIDNTGQVTSSASTTGSTVITATAGDATSDPFTVNVVTCGTPFTAPSGKVYNTAAYSNANLTNLCWTTTNLQEAGYSATCYSNNCGTYPTRGYYYSVGANPDKACAALNSGDGSVWRVPTGTEWAALQTAFPSLAAGTGTTGNTAALQADWNGTAAMTGDSTSGSGWYAWGGHGNWWAQGTSGLFTGINSGATTMYSGTGTYWLAVRCVRSL